MNEEIRTISASSREASRRRRERALEVFATLDARPDDTLITPAVIEAMLAISASTRDRLSKAGMLPPLIKVGSSNRGRLGDFRAFVARRRA